MRRPTLLQESHRQDRVGARWARARHKSEYIFFTPRNTASSERAFCVRFSSTLGTIRSMYS